MCLTPDHPRESRFRAWFREHIRDERDLEEEAKLPESWVERGEQRDYSVNIIVLLVFFFGTVALFLTIEAFQKGWVHW